MFESVFNSLVGGVASGYSAYTQAQSAREANETNMRINDQQIAFNREQAQIGRDFEERMSNSAWQRGTADMKAAGINPMAAYSSGGASTPGGPVAQAGSLRGVERVPSIPGQILTSALEIAKTFSEMNKNKATTINIDRDTRMKDIQSEDIYMSALHKTWLNKMIEAELPSARSKAFSDVNRMEAERKFPRTYGHMDAFLRRFSGPLANFGNSALSMYLGSKLPRLSRRLQ